MRSKWATGLYPNPECSASTQMTSACVSPVRRQRIALNKLAPESRLGIAHRPCRSAGSKDFPTKPSHRSLAALSSSSFFLASASSINPQPRSSNAHLKAQRSSCACCVCFKGFVSSPRSSLLLPSPPRRAPPFLRRPRLPRLAVAD